MVFQTTFSQNDEMTDIEKQQVGENVVPSTPPNKKAKLDIDKNSPASSSECLTPEQRAMINRKAVSEGYYLKIGGARI